MRPVLPAGRARSSRARFRTASSPPSKVAQKVRARGGDWGTARALLLSYELTVEPVTLVDAEHAAGLWSPGRGLSLADRLCIALSHRLGVDALTADRAWGDGRGIRQIR